MTTAAGPQKLLICKTYLLHLNLPLCSQDQAFYNCQVLSFLNDLPSRCLLPRCPLGSGLHARRAQNPSVCTEGHRYIPRHSASGLRSATANNKLSILILHIKFNAILAYEL